MLKISSLFKFVEFVGPTDGQNELTKCFHTLITKYAVKYAYGNRPWKGQPFGSIQNQMFI